MDFIIYHGNFRTCKSRDLDIMNPTSPSLSVSKSHLRVSLWLPHPHLISSKSQTSLILINKLKIIILIINIYKYFSIYLFRVKVFKKT